MRPNWESSSAGCLAPAAPHAVRLRESGEGRPLSVPTEAPDSCLECGYALAHQGGCSYCPLCGWSRCCA